MEISETQKDEIKELVRNNEKIEAIKILKSRYNLSLKEATILVKVIDKEVAHRKPANKVKKRSSSIFIKIAGGIFAIIGMGFAAISINSLLNDKEIIERSEIIKGVVIENPNQPVVQFDYGGEPRTIQAQVNSNPPAFEIGEEVEVFINKSNPMEVHINSFSDRFFISIFFGTLGIVFTGIGTVVFFKFKTNGH